jgi:hypothetical protein
VRRDLPMRPEMRARIINLAIQGLSVPVISIRTGLSEARVRRVLYYRGIRAGKADGSVCARFAESPNNPGISLTGPKPDPDFNLGYRP